MHVVIKISEDLYTRLFDNGIELTFSEFMRDVFSCYYPTYTRSTPALKTNNVYKKAIISPITFVAVTPANIAKLDVTKLSKAEYSGVIDDVTKLQNYKEPTIIIPTMILSKKGKVVYVQEGLAYSTDLIPNIEKNDIE